MWSKKRGEHRTAIKEWRKGLWEAIRLISVLIQAAYQEMEEPPSSIAQGQLLFPPHSSTEEAAGANQSSYEPPNSDQPLLTRGSQVWEVEGAEMLLSAACAFVN